MTLAVGRSPPTYREAKRTTRGKCPRSYARCRDGVSPRIKCLWGQMMKAWARQTSLNLDFVGYLLVFFLFHYFETSLLVWPAKIEPRLRSQGRLICGCLLHRIGMCYDRLRLRTIEKVTYKASIGIEVYIILLLLDSNWKLRKYWNIPQIYASLP